MSKWCALKDPHLCTGKFSKDRKMTLLRDDFLLLQDKAAFSLALWSGVAELSNLQFKNDAFDKSLTASTHFLAMTLTTRMMGGSISLSPSSREC